MKNHHKTDGFRLTCLALALAAAYSPAGAAELDPERAAAIAELASPSNNVRLGLGAVSDDNRRFGQYSGLQDEGAYAVADLSYRRLDRESGTWLGVYGRNLGLDSRELGVDHYRQGVWRYQLGYSQTPRYEPMVVNTRLGAIGSSQQSINTETRRPVDLKMTRELVSLGSDYSFGRSNTVRLRYTHEDKEGERLFGRGSTGVTPAGQPTVTEIEFLAEPLRRNTQTLELSLSHVGTKLQLSGGYYGTLFVNHAERLDVAGIPGSALNAATNNVPAFTPMSMPLSNDSHQAFLSGGYNLSPLTRLAFKTSYTVARQDENLITVSHLAAPPASAASSLDGEVVTTLAYFDLTSLEIDRFDLQANLRYEDRDDQTPRRQYLNAQNTAGTAAGLQLAGMDGTNKPRSWRSLKSKLEAGYQLPANFKLVGSVELDDQERSVPEPFRRVGYREETDETTSRVEIKRLIADAATGALAYSQARRRGSEYLTDTYDLNGATAGQVPSNLVNPLLWADRDRDAWRATLDWVPFDEFSLHFIGELSADRYSGRTLGPRAGDRNYYSFDASYALNSRWQATMFFSRDDTRAKQRTQTNNALGATAVITRWEADLRQRSDALGVGLHGKLRNGVELGGDLNLYRELAENRMASLTAGSTITPLPNIRYRTTELKLSGSYPLGQNAKFALDYLYQDWKTNDWTWDGWVYSDGTTLTQEAHQKTHFLSASYHYRWR